MKEPKLPQGYEYLGDVVKKAQGRLREIDELIENVQQDRYDTPSPKPAGTVEPGIRGQQANEIARLNGQKETVRSDANKTIDAELKDVDPATKKEIKDHAEHQLSEGVYDKGTMKAFEQKQSEFDRLRDVAQSEREAIQQYLSEQDKDNDTPPSALDKTSFGQFMVSKEIAAEFERHSPEQTKEKQPDGAEKNEQSKESQPKASEKEQATSGSQKDTQPNDAKKEAPGKDPDGFESHSALENSSFTQGQASSDLKANYSTNTKDITSPEPDKD
jgi:hypothetical protein